MSARHLAAGAALLAAAALVLAQACSGGGSSGKGVPAASTDYVVLAWNDLGMHCLNPTYDQAVVLPPYNTIWAQVVKRGNPPQLVTAGLRVEYMIVGNTRSHDKASYGQFWANAGQLFGATPAPDHGLNLVDPGISNGLSGAMVVKGDRFEVDGIPVVPISDDGQWNPFQRAMISVRDAATGALLVQAEATVPTSDELDCKKCHGADPFADLLAKHDASQGTSLVLQKPVLCARCHASPALGQPARFGQTQFLSEAVHGFHGALSPDRRPACYDCHPGPRTQCSRSNAHTAADGNCTHCHGALSEVGASITENRRVPWVGEPACVDCHAGVPGVDTGTTLYRHAKGHGGIHCAGCHGSPHAMVPTRVASDAAQMEQYQGAAVPLGDCNACHGTSRGGGLSEFGEAHGGASPEARNACAVCHTVVPGTGQLAEWPHGFGWKTRSIPQ